MKFAAIALLMLVSLPAAAFTPESGWWWNPDESGRGFNIEIQDDVIVVSTYVYDADGNPVWYLSAGRLNRQANRYTGTLDRFDGGQCIECDQYTQPEYHQRAAGNIVIDFLTETTAELTWKGGTIPIQRQIFAFGDELDTLLGQWQMVVDSSDANGGDADYQADVLTFDKKTSDEQGPYVAGFRPKSQYDRTGIQGDVGNAAADYTPPSGGDPGFVTIVVHNSPNEDNWWLAQYLVLGTNSVEGFAEVYCRQCDPQGGQFPVRGFRTQSGAYVTEGHGPSKALVDARPTAEAGIRLPAAGGTPAKVSVPQSAVIAARRLTTRLRGWIRY